MHLPHTWKSATMREEARSAAFWRDVFAECFATFLMVSIQCVLPLPWERDEGFSQAVMTGLGMGFIVACMAWSLGDFGGAHMNPAVTIAITLSLKVTPFRAIMYILVQIGGATMGAYFSFSITPESYRGNLATTTLGPEVDVWQGFLTEAWITCIHVITIFGSTNSSRKKNLFIPPLIIGLVVSVCIWAAWNHTGASMNPARSLGPAIVMGIWDDHWVYWAGPITGGAIAALIYVVAFDRVDRCRFDSSDNISDSGRENYKLNDKGDDSSVCPAGGDIFMIGKQQNESACSDDNRANSAKCRTICITSIGKTVCRSPNAHGDNFTLLSCDDSGVCPAGSDIFMIR